MTLSPLQKRFIDNAKYSWINRHVAYALGMNLSEETLTELFLFNLAASSSKNIFVKAFKKREEHENGADWEWCFASPQLTHFLRVRVQAKALYPDRTYQALDFLGKLQEDKTRATPQIETFVKRSSEAKLRAIYAFYNFGIVTPPKSFSPTAEEKEHSPSLWGASVADAESVLAAGKKEFKTLAEFSEPWHRLFDALSAHWTLDTVAAVLDALRASGQSATGSLSASVPHAHETQRPEYFNFVVRQATAWKASPDPERPVSGFGTTMGRMSITYDTQQNPDLWQSSFEERNPHLAGIIVFVQPSGS